jgi:BirA family transcriptional regulator, biotin operon repressor / biotin---[acetyl-CoA-carboxylase] ligase
MKALMTELLQQGWLKSAEHFSQVDSTNSAARRFGLACESRALPAIFVADEQTAGRGRAGHVWWSPQGCLMFTVLLAADFLPESRSTWGQLALVTGVSAALAIESVCPEIEVQLKWPNDLYLNGRKLGGILIESFNAPTRDSQGNSTSLFAIGIGLNTTVDWETAPSDVAIKATCLAAATQRVVSREEMLLEIVQSLYKQLQLWRQHESSWFEHWIQRCLLAGKYVQVKSVANLSQKICGQCLGVALDGQLLILDPAGQLCTINSGEIVHWSLGGPV